MMSLMALQSLYAMLYAKFCDVCLNIRLATLRHRGTEIRIVRDTETDIHKDR